MTDAVNSGLRPRTAPFAFVPTPSFRNKASVKALKLALSRFDCSDRLFVRARFSKRVRNQSHFLETKKTTPIFLVVLRSFVRREHELR